MPSTLPPPPVPRSTLAQRPPHWRIPGHKPLNTRPLATSEGAYYKILFPSPGGAPRRITANQNSTGSAKIVVPWWDCQRFETDALGNSIYVSGQKYLKRRTPLRHGDPAQPSLFLDSLETVNYHNFDKSTQEALTAADGTYSAGWPRTQMVAYAALFSQRSYSILEDADVSGLAVPELSRYVEKFPETDGFHRKIPGWGIAFDSDLTKKVTTLGSLPEYQQQWTYTTYFWPVAYYGGELWDAGNSIPLGTIARTLGTVNDAPFDVNLKLEALDGSTLSGFPAEELKYEFCRISKPYYGADDKLYCDIQHVFNWNHRNWNKQLNPSKDPTSTTAPYIGGFEYMQLVNANNSAFSPIRRPFVKTNFNRLFFPRGAP